MAEPALKIENAEDLGKLGGVVCGALTAGDVNTALLCYEPGATVVLDSGERAVGRDEIGKAFVEFTTNSPTFTYLKAEILESGDLALIRHSWNFNGLDPDGNHIKEDFTGTGIARRQPSGEWLIVIDSPYNAE